MKYGDIIDIDDLVCLCGCFVSDTHVNNGYGCNHPRAYERGEIDEGIGLCHAKGCPLGNEFVRGMGCDEDDKLDVDDLKRLGLDIDDECWFEEGRFVILEYASLEESIAPGFVDLHS